MIDFSMSPRLRLLLNSLIILIVRIDVRFVDGRRFRLDASLISTNVWVFVRTGRRIVGVIVRVLARPLRVTRSRWRRMKSRRRLMHGSRLRRSLLSRTHIVNGRIGTRLRIRRRTLNATRRRFRTRVMIISTAAARIRSIWYRIAVADRSRTGRNGGRTLRRTKAAASRRQLRPLRLRLLLRNASEMRLIVWQRRSRHRR